MAVKIVNMILCSIWRNFIGNRQISSSFYLIEIGPNGYFSRKDSLSYTLFFVFENLESVKENTWLFIKIGLTSSPWMQRGLITVKTHSDGVTRRNYVSQLIRGDPRTPDSAGAVMSELTWVPPYLLPIVKMGNETGSSWLTGLFLEYCDWWMMIILQSKIKSALC